eukprot:scaffold227127_cov15-Tisochrysis_lutea.AAC.1
MALSSLGLGPNHRPNCSSQHYALRMQQNRQQGTAESTKSGSRGYGVGAKSTTKQQICAGKSTRTTKKAEDGPTSTKSNSSSRKTADYLSIARLIRHSSLQVLHGCLQAFAGAQVVRAHCAPVQSARIVRDQLQCFAA